MVEVVPFHDGPQECTRGPSQESVHVRLEDRTGRRGGSDDVKAFGILDGLKQLIQQPLLPLVSETRRTPCQQREIARPAKPEYQGELGRPAPRYNQLPRHEPRPR